MRNRIRSHGIRVLGPIDHGFVQSIYFAGPEGLALEVACGRDIDGDLWVDPDVQELCGISAGELAALKSPSPYEQPAKSLAQPPKDPSKPQMWFGQEGLPEAVMDAPDEAIWADMSDTTPPGAAAD